MIQLFDRSHMSIGSSIRVRWKVLGLAYNRRETRDRRPLGRDSDRSWYHRNTTSMIKLFFFTVHGSMGIGGSMWARWKVLDLAYVKLGTSGHWKARWKTVINTILKILKIKSLAYSLQGSHTGQLGFCTDWQMAARRGNVISITLRQV